MKKNIINFDSTNWDSIRDTIDKINEIGSMQVGETSEGDRIIFDVAKSDEGYDILRTDTFQSNGWIRTNYYDPREYTIEELYKKERA